MTHLLLPIVAGVPGRRYAAVPVRRSHSRATFQENRGKQLKQELVIHFLVLYFNARLVSFSTQNDIMNLSCWL